MANGTDDRVFDLMESTFVEDLPLWDEKHNQVYYQVPGKEGKEHPYYKPGAKTLRRHERVIKVTLPQSGDTIREEVSSPTQRGLIPLMPTGPKDLIAETILSAIGESKGPGAEIGAVIGLGAGIRGGKYLVAGVDKLLEGGKKGAKLVDDAVGHEYTKHQYRRAFNEMKDDPMLGHIPFKKVSRFEKPGSPYTSGTGNKYGAYYSHGAGEEMFHELFPPYSKGWYAQTDPKTGYTPSMKTEWRGGTEHMGQVSGKHKPFTFRTNPFSRSFSQRHAKSLTVHEGRHNMQHHPMTPNVGYNPWEETIAGKKVFNVSKMYGSYPGSRDFKTLIDVPVPKSVQWKIDRGFPLNTKEKPHGNVMGNKAGFRKEFHYGGSVSPIKHRYDMMTGKELKKGDKNYTEGKGTWYNYTGPIEVEARLAQLYEVGPGASKLWQSLKRDVGYTSEEIAKMLDDYGLAREAMYGSRPGGGFSARKITVKGKDKIEFYKKSSSK